MARTQVVAVVDSHAATPEEVARLLADGADTVEIVGATAGAETESVKAVAAAHPGRVRCAADASGAVPVTDDLAAMAVAAVLGCHEIRTRAVRAARRVVDVVAAIEGAR